MAGVRRNLPAPCGSVDVVQLSSGPLVELPAALRQAALVTVEDGTPGTVTGPMPFAVLL